MNSIDYHSKNDFYSNDLLESMASALGFYVVEIVKEENDKKNAKGEFKQLAVKELHKLLSDAIRNVTWYFFPLYYLMPKDIRLRSFLVNPVNTIGMYWPETSPERLFDNMLQQIEAFEFLDIPHGWIHQHGRINEKVVKTVKNSFIGCKSLEEVLIKKDLMDA